MYFSFSLIFDDNNKQEDQKKLLLLVYFVYGSADAYKQHGSPISWHRYSVLGYYVCDNCTDFEKH